MAFEILADWLLEEAVDIMVRQSPKSLVVRVNFRTLQYLTSSLLGQEGRCLLPLKAVVMSSSIKEME